MIGVHAPEFAFERNPDNVRKAVTDLGIRYPVALDNKLHRVDRAQEQLLARPLFLRCCKGASGTISSAKGITTRRKWSSGNCLPRPDALPKRAAWRGRPPRVPRAAAAIRSIRSPETYIGYARADRFVSPGGQARDAAKSYAAAPLQLNDWGLEGNWTSVARAEGRTRPAERSPIAFTPATCTWCCGSEKPVRFRLTIDGKPPGADAGVDVKADGTGVVHERAALSTGPAEGRGSRSHVPDRIPRPRRRRRSPLPSADQRSLSQIMEMIRQPSSGWRNSWIELIPRRSGSAVVRRCAALRNCSTRAPCCRTRRCAGRSRLRRSRIGVEKGRGVFGIFVEAHHLHRRAGPARRPMSAPGALRAGSSCAAATSRAVRRGRRSSRTSRR